MVSPISAVGGAGFTNFADLLAVSTIASASSAVTPVASTAVSKTEQTNEDGTITTTVTYADGTQSVTVEPNPDIPRVVGFFDALNFGQLSVLLQAQEHRI